MKFQNFQKNFIADEKFFQSAMKKNFYRQHRTEIVVQMHSQIFGRLCINFAGILTYVKKFVCKMPENMQADVPQSRQAVFVQWCL